MDELSNILVIGEHMPARLERAPAGVPQSYLELLRGFGVGEFVDTYRILPPGELVTYGELMRAAALDLPDELASILICAAGNEGSYFGWRPEHTTPAEHRLIWIPRGCFDLDDPDTRPQQAASDIMDLVAQWTLPRWAGSGIVQPYFVSRQQWDTAESLVPLLRGASAGLDALIPEALAAQGGRILYRHSRIGQLTLRCYLPIQGARVYLQSRATTANPDALSVRVVTAPGRTPSAKQVLSSVEELLLWAKPAQWGGA